MVRTRRAFRWLLAAAFLLGPAMLAPATLSPALAQTVDEIVSRGTVNIGVTLDTPPYGLLNDKQEPDGYDADVARLLGRYLGVKVNIVQVSSANRIPFLVTNKVDLIVATHGITPERARQVMFSAPYNAIDSVVFAPKGSAITSLDDLKGLRVGVPRGTIQDTILSQRYGAAIRLMRFDDDASTYQAILNGQVDAIVHTAVVGAGIFAAHPELQIEQKVTLVQQPNGISMRKGQWDLHQWVNTFVYYVKSNGELDAIYQKWFHRPMPNFPSF